MASNFCLKFCLLFLVLFVIAILKNSCHGEEKKSEPTNKKEKSKKIGKNVMDYTEADLHKLFDQWDVSTKGLFDVDAFICLGSILSLFLFLLFYLVFGHVS